MAACPYCGKSFPGNLQAHMAGCTEGPLPQRPCPCGGVQVPYSKRNDWLCLIEHQLYDIAGNKIPWTSPR